MGRRNKRNLLSSTFSSTIDGAGLEKNFLGNDCGILSDRPAKIARLKIEWASTSGSAAPFSVAVSDGLGAVITRSTPRVASFTSQRMTLEVPRSTDFGFYQPADLVVSVSGTNVSFVVTFITEYGPQDIRNV